MGVATTAGASRRRSPRECLIELPFFKVFQEKLVVRIVLYPFICTNDLKKTINEESKKE
jgi:hypothetical protein